MHCLHNLLYEMGILKQFEVSLAGIGLRIFVSSCNSVITKQAKCIELKFGNQMTVITQQTHWCTD